MPKVETQNIPSELMGSYLMALQIETDTPLLSGSAPFTGYVKKRNPFELPATRMKPEDWKE